MTGSVPPVAFTPGQWPSVGVCWTQPQQPNPGQNACAWSEDATTGVQQETVSWWDQHVGCSLPEAGPARTAHETHLALDRRAVEALWRVSGCGDDHLRQLVEIAMPPPSRMPLDCFRGSTGPCTAPPVAITPPSVGRYDRAAIQASCAATAAAPNAVKDRLGQLHKRANQVHKRLSPACR